jgi:hypothetical protein
MIFDFEKYYIKSDNKIDNKLLGGKIVIIILRHLILGFDNNTYQITLKSKF